MLVLVAVVVGIVVGALIRAPIQRIAGADELRMPRALVEVLTGVVFGALAWSIGWNWALPAFLWLGAAGVAMGVIDVGRHRLPNVLTLSCYPVLGGLLLIPALVDDNWAQYGRAWIAAAILFIAYLILALIYPAGMGLGDVKLAGVLGLALGWLGWAELVVGGFLAFMLGAVTGIGLMLAGRAKRKTAIPFGPFMLGGALIAIMFAAAISRWYLSFAISP